MRMRIRLVETKDELLQVLADHFRDKGDAGVAYNIEEKMRDFERERETDCEVCKDGYYCYDCDTKLPPQKCGDCHE